MTLRRSSDNATTDVYFDASGWVTLYSETGTVGSGITLETWVGSNSAYVTKWYDQSGNGNHATTAVNSGTITVAVGSTSVSGGTTANVNVTAFKSELLAGDILYKLDGTTIGTVASNPTSESALTLSAGAAVALTAQQFTSSAQTLRQPRFINVGVIETLSNGRPALNILNGNNARTANGFTTPITLSPDVNGNENVNAFVVPYRTNNSQNDALIIGNVANYTTANSVNALAFGYNNSTTLGVRNGQVVTLTTSLNKSEAVRYYANALSATKKVGIVSLDATNVTSSANTNGTYSLTHTRSLNLFRVDGYPIRSFTGKCPELVLYKSNTITADFNSADATTLLATQRTTYMSEIVPIGASSTYKTIQTAYDAIKAAAVSTPISNQYILEIQSDYDPSSGTTLETYPITLNAINGASSANTITIRPAGGVTKTLSSSSNKILSLDGAKYVIIDGRAGGVGEVKGLTLSNSNTAASSLTVELINDAANNTLRYCTIKGSATSTTSAPTSGTIVIGTTTGTTAQTGTGAASTMAGSGNNLNTIDNCDIADASGGFPTVGIYNLGVSSSYGNYFNTISNCNIYNCFNPGAFQSAGIYLNDYSYNTIMNGNKIYQTDTRTYTHTSGEGINYGIYSIYPIWSLTNNTIGYSSNSQTGKYTIDGNKNCRFIGIYLYRAINGSDCYGNNIANIDVTTSSVGTSNTGTVCGIYTNNNLPAATAASPNLIHDITVRNSASTTGTHTLCGFSVNSAGVPNIVYNNIYNLNVIPTGDAIIGKLMGIFVGASNNHNISKNKVYDLTCGYSGSTAAHVVTGISSTSANKTVTTDRNLVDNLITITTGAAAITGITGANGTGTWTIKNNIIRLGSNVGGDVTIYGLSYIIGNSASQCTNVFNYNNTICIQGSVGVTATRPTFIIYLGGSYAATNHTIQNNIFANQRANNATIPGTAKHYVFRFAYTTLNTIKVLNNNLYWATPIGLYSASNTEYANLAAWKQSGGNSYILITNDENSTEGNPQFLSAADLRVQTYSSAVAAKGANIASVTDDYYGTTRAANPAIGAYEFTYASQASDNYKSLASGNWGTAATWQSSVDNANWANATLAPTSSAASVLIQNGHEVTVAAATTAPVLTIQGGGKLTIEDYNLTAASLNLQSDVNNGTATIKDLSTAGNLTVNGTTTTNQYVTTGRNWYITTPSSATALPTVSSGTITLNGYSETAVTDAAGATGWVPTPSTFDAGKGYVASVSANGNITFTGALNTGAKNIALTSRTGTANKAGFNLIGNPYPSYLDWTAVTDDVNNAAKLRSTTLWYRTKMLNEQSEMVYSFWTVNGDGVGVPTGASSKIPPMQSFWVRAVAGGGNLALTNAMRSHAPATDKLMKAPAVKNADRTLVRLQVSNGINTDEAVVYFSPKAKDGFDSYDAPKMSNGNAAIPEIYTTLNAEKIAINSMQNIPTNTPIGIGFTAGNAGSYPLRDNEISN